MTWPNRATMAAAPDAIDGARIDSDRLEEVVA
jgi:hypothetical protein